MSEFIPIIDFQTYGLHVPDYSSVDVTAVEKIAEDLYKTFSTIGFCYIVNHGIPQTTIDDVFRTSKDFFTKPVSEKEPYTRDVNFGWDGLGNEKLNTGVSDYKESFNFYPLYRDEEAWCGDMQVFRSSYTALFDKCRQLTDRLLDILSVSLKIKDVDYLRRCHSLMARHGNLTDLRSIYYPEIPTDRWFKPGLARCGEHTDYATITLLFQDMIGGLEVQNTAGEYVPATPIPGSVVVNLGDLMQRWTADELKATKHRVLIPETDCKRKRSRQSIAFFVSPNDDTVIKCLDGSNKYDPVNFEDFLHNKFKMTFKNFKQ